MFWAGRADIIVIDSMIFDYMTSMMAGEFDTNISLDRRRILKAWTIESIAFRDRELRDQFNIGLARLQGRGGVAKIYRKYRSFGAQRATKSH